MKISSLRFGSHRILSIFALTAAVLAPFGLRAAPGDLFASVHHATSRLSDDAIFQFTPTGGQSTFLAGLKQARGLAFDSSGNLFVATTPVILYGGTVLSSGTIFKVTPDGTPSTFANFDSNFFIEGLAIDSANNVFAAAFFSVPADPNSELINNFHSPADPGLAIGSHSKGSMIFKFTRSGRQSVFAVIDGRCFGLALDADGNLYAAAGDVQTIYKFTSLGRKDTFVGPSAFSVAQFPFGLAFDSSGNLFVSTQGNPGSDAILKFSPAAAENTFATGLSNARALTFDNAGNLFVAELSDVGFVTTGGTILEFAPSGGQTVFATGIGFSFPGGPEFLTFER